MHVGHVSHVIPLDILARPLGGLAHWPVGRCPSHCRCLLTASPYPRRDGGGNRMRYAACDLPEEAGSGSRGRPSSRSSLLLLLMICPSSWSAVPSSVNGT